MSRGQILKKEYTFFITELIIGALVGLFIFHPLSMLINEGFDIVALYDKERLQHYISSSMSLFFGLFGIVLAVLFEMSRITLKKKNDLLEKQKKELHDLNATKDKFFSIIAHDLKNPLSSLLSLSELLFHEYEMYDHKTKKEFIKLIYEGSQNTYKLSENLLTWSHSQRGKVVFNPVNLNLRELIDENAILFNQNAIEKGICMKSEVNEDSYFNTDRDLVNTVIRNLLANAIKFTPQKGEVSISARILSGKDQNETIEISVKDSGIGISQKNMENLFNIEKNQSTPGTNGEKGTGLGLILCKEFIEKCEGKIWVESKIGKGSEFKFTLPNIKYHER